jgi:hypothetical protein
MRALRVRTRHDGGGRIKVHWLRDRGRTFCGRKRVDLDVIEELELESLPTVEGCHSCERLADPAPRGPR